MPIKFPSIPNYRDTVQDPDLMNRYIHTPVVITEKLDGLNVLLHNGNCYTRDNSAEPENKRYLAMVKKHHAWKTAGNRDRYVWGEDLFAEHSCKYMPIEEARTFRAFMVSTNGRYALSWAESVRSMSSSDIESVPVLFSDRFKSRAHLHGKIIELMEGMSALGGDLEGLVVRRSNGFLLSEAGKNMFKVVRKGHVQQNAEHWRKNWKHREIIWEE